MQMRERQTKMETMLEEEQEMEKISISFVRVIERVDLKQPATRSPKSIKDPLGLQEDILIMPPEERITSEPIIEKGISERVGEQTNSLDVISYLHCPANERIMCCGIRFPLKHCMQKQHTGSPFLEKLDK